MQIILHRVNTTQQLKLVGKKYGVEVDIRTYGDELILHHDPFQCGESLRNWLKYFDHKTIIANVKEEGLEGRILKEFKKRNITNFFFLDQSFPFLMKLMRTNEKRTAVRYSDFESIETVMSLTGKVDWVWIDSFDRFTLTSEQNKNLKNMGFKLCLVSPELQGQDLLIEGENIRQSIIEGKLEFDAICTKNPSFWE